MRIIVFFDLPTETGEDKRSYRKFRTFLIKKGFLMMQESVYCKLVPNQTAAYAVAEMVKVNSPTKGLVQMLTITEKQFAKMEYVVGKRQTSILDTDDRLVIL